MEHTNRPSTRNRSALLRCDTVIDQPGKKKLLSAETQLDITNWITQQEEKSARRKREEQSRLMRCETLVQIPESPIRKLMRQDTVLDRVASPARLAPPRLSLSPSNSPKNSPRKKAANDMECCLVCIAGGQQDIKRNLGCRYILKCLQLAVTKCK